MVCFGFAPKNFGLALPSIRFLKKDLKMGSVMLLLEQRLVLVWTRQHTPVGLRELLVLKKFEVSLECEAFTWIVTHLHRGFEISIIISRVCSTTFDFFILLLGFFEIWFGSSAQFGEQNEKVQSEFTSSSSNNSDAHICNCFDLAVEASEQSR